MGGIVSLSLLGAILKQQIGMIKPITIESKNTVNISAKVEEPEPVVEDPEPTGNTYETRLTSYWANDEYETGSCTGSGLCEKDFQVNEKGWYTYQGKLVVATATTYLANQGWETGNVHLRKYYDEIIINIDGTDYQAIVLDSCGNCMKTDRVDLFIKNGSVIKDTNVIVKEK